MCTQSLMTQLYAHGVSLLQINFYFCHLSLKFLVLSSLINDDLLLQTPQVWLWSLTVPLVALM